ncbi:hypothetical protein NKW54_05480 [Acetobacter cerevisiae]|uniref:Uncharacterized protein n=1 Tax=Acetobacter cerevisiae TaxID=178900 RepID=A0A149UY02_9PROT|nr:hypothetical protein [Acetobacter cerevisiae]KXV72860.1 hypothetical protein AD952_01780 [Acetobacter cerevisiae]MCP1245392.1 hypothetical protein [Acetobacter cerevisiae]MCP1254968.1 hypothetical protein [Acetobacter cerevisiae]
MSVGIDQAQSNGPLNVQINGSAPGTKGDTGLGISEIAMGSAGQAVITMTDGSTRTVDATALSEIATKAALEELGSGGLPEIDLSHATIGQYTMEDVAFAALGKSGLPVDVTNNGGLIMAGPTPLPDGYMSNGGVVMQTTAAG